MNQFYNTKMPFQARNTYQSNQTYQNNQINQNNQPNNHEEEMDFNIPSTPILYNMSPEKIIQTLHETIVDEATAIDFYTRLAKDAPTQLAKEFVLEALSEEKKHLVAFSKVYEFYTDKMPQYTIKPVVYNSFKEGILHALKDELDAADMYKNMTVSTTDNLVVETYHFAGGDELEHAIMFSVIYGQL